MAMTCADAEDLIEAVAAGETPPAGELAAHLADCRRCAAALATASRIERALVALPAPSAPVRFAQDVLAAIRRERWRSEERVDRVFNVTIAAAIVVVAAALVSLLNLGSLAQMLIAAAEKMSAIPQRPPAWPPPAPLPVLSLAVVLVTMAVGVWWWAERRSPYEGD